MFMATIGEYVKEKKIVTKAFALNHLSIIVTLQKILTKRYDKLANVAIANALQLETARRRTSRSLVLGCFFVRMRIIKLAWPNSFRTSDQHSDVAIRIQRPQFSQREQ